MKAKSARSGPAVKTVVPSAIRGNRKLSSKTKDRIRIPPILFEGDEARPTIPPVPEPAPAKFATGVAPVPGQIEVELDELPPSYGTHKLLLLVRDPHWLYSHWDITLAQLQKYNALSTHKHLVLKVRENGHAQAQEIHIHPESRSWFVHVDRAETEYVAELGYYREDQSWVPVTVSESVVTPPESESQDRTVQFATMPPSAPVTPEAQAGEQTLFARRYALVQGELFQQNVPGFGASEAAVLSFESPGLLGEWTVAQEQRLAKEVHPYSVQRTQAGSIELLDLIGGPSSWESISSQMAEQSGPEFWLNVNAELLIYGATKPDARLTLDGQSVVLAPDGTFSFRISLPDGQYEAKIQAVSVEGDSRQVKLKFTRCTEWR